MIKVAVIGLGKMGLLHASLLNVIPDVKLVAVYEKSRLISRFSKNVFSSVTVVTDINDLSGLHLDAVYVTTPTSTHYAIVGTILTHGICRNVFVEKPLANNDTESVELCNLINRSGNGGVNMVGYNRRFNLTFRKAREIISEGILGEPLSFEAYAFSSDFQTGHQEGKRLHRGGVLRDLGCHAIDIAIWYMGNINIKSVNSSNGSTDGVLDSVSFEVCTENGIKGQINTSWCKPKYRLPEIGFVIKGTKGQTLVVNDDKVELRQENGEVKAWHKQDLKDNTYFMLGGTDYYREDEEYMNAVKTGKAVEPDFYTASKVDEIIGCAEKLLAGQGYGQ